jgi:flagellar basal-body rod modification protein FlgD
MIINSATSPATTTAAADTQARLPQQVLGQNEFLKLLTVQLAQQDPLAPMTDQAFVAQMAQFSALEQSSQMSKEMSLMRADAQMQAAGALIGREVTVAMPDGDVTGTVNEVASDGGSMHIRIGETYYPLPLVYRVSAPTPPAPTS